MREIHFSRWEEVLAKLDLPERRKQSWIITIRWYLSFCRRGRSVVTAQSARDFVAWAQMEKVRPEWQVEEWKNALRWFFQAALGASPAPAPGRPDSPKAVPPVAAAPVFQPATPGRPESRRDGLAEGADWKAAFLTVVRRRKYSYRTEQSYLVWIERFVRHVKTSKLEALGGEQIKGFLNDLAVREQLSASSQRQAFERVEG